MFNGIIKEIGTIAEIKSASSTSDKNDNKSDSPANKTFKVFASKIFTQKPIGASIAVDGVCMTLTAKDEKSFQVVAMPETLNRTISGEYKVGTQVNLEPPIQLGEDISGHPVMGHVDEISQITNISKNKNGKIFEINFSNNIAKYLSFKGSVCVNGISLTISKLNENSFEVSIIPHTLDSTNIKNLKIGDKVNIEVDMFARYLERLVNAKESQVKYEYLKERGFI